MKNGIIIINTIINIPQELREGKRFYISFAREPDWKRLPEDLRTLKADWKTKENTNGIKDRQPLIAEFEADHIYFKPARWKSDTQPYTFEEALQILEKFPELPLSIGIVLRKGDGLTVIDLDDVLTTYGEIVGNPKLSPEDVEWILSVTDSYTEISSSGFGLHIFVKADYPNNERSPFEMAGRDKYIVLTGNIWNNKNEVRENQKAIDLIAKRFFNQDLETIREKNTNNQTCKFKSLSSKNKKLFSVKIIEYKNSDFIVVNNLKALFCSLDFWKIFYKKLFVSLYGRSSFDFGIEKNLLSVMREEKHPSFWLVENKHGEIEAFDFGISEKPFRIQEVYKAFKEAKDGKNEEFKHIEDLKELKEWTWQLIKDFNVLTEEAFNYMKKIDQFLEAIEAPKRFKKVFDVIGEHLKDFARFGRSSILTVRRLEDLTGVDYATCNKALNIMATCQLFQKGDLFILENGLTNALVPNLGFDLEESIDIFDKIKAHLKGRGGLNRFSRETVEAIGLECEQIFKRDWEDQNDSQTGSNEDLQRTYSNGKPELAKQGYISDNLRTFTNSRDYRAPSKSSCNFSGSKTRSLGEKSITTKGQEGQEKPIDPG